MSNSYAENLLKTVYADRGGAIDAKKARELAQAHKKTSTLNYTLHMRSIFSLIEAAAKNGDTLLQYEVKEWIPDGTKCDPIVVAKQLKHTLSSDKLGFKVKRTDKFLEIDWS
ncbi:hypothetical protein [Sicyoidochytrium minutum DNA virus]|nr:hypothetical protein [Sicyoidochytrium minutum DNA virus]